MTYQKTKWPPPYGFRDRVCDCLGPTKHVAHPEREGANACAQCLKYFRYVVRQCLECKEPYLATSYSGPFLCITDTRCYEHRRTEECSHPDCRRVFGGIAREYLEERDLYPLPPDSFTSLTKTRLRSFEF